MTRLLVSYCLTTLCAWTLSFVIPLAIYTLTTSPMWTSLTYAVEVLPYLIVTPFAGVWSDRYAKRTFLIGGDVANVIVAVVTCFVMAQSSGHRGAVCLLVLAFVCASVTAIHHPIFQSIAPETLSKESLPSFNAVVNAFDNVISIVAPTLVAIAMKYMPKQEVALLSTCGFALSVPVLWGIRAGRVGRAGSTSVLADLAEGIKYVVHDSNLMSFSMLFACVNFGLSIISANLVYIFTALYGVSQDNIGYYFAVIGLGAVVGSLCAPWLMATLGDARVIIGCCLAAGVTALVAATARTAWAYAAEWCVATACISAVIVTFFTFRQRVVPAELLGRTVGVTRIISYAAIAPASIVGGLLMERFQSAPVVMLVGGVAICTGAAVAHVCARYIERSYRPQRKVAEQ